MSAAVARRRGLVAALLTWLWPAAVHDAPYGRRHGLAATLFGWAWPSGFDRGLRRWWHFSWLWSWMWPGHVLGPDGEVCALAPWHPALRPEACPGEPWRHKLRRHGPVMFMMFGATAIAAPTLMEGNGVMDGGRVNLFHTDGPPTQGPPAGGDAGPTADPGAGPGRGGDLTTPPGGDLFGGGGDGPQGPTGPDNPFPPDAGPDGGGVGGGGGDPPTGGDPSPDPDTNVVDDPSGDLTTGLPLGGGAGGGGGGGGGGGSFDPPGPGLDPTGPLSPTNPGLEPNQPGPGPGGGSGPGRPIGPGPVILPRDEDPPPPVQPPGGSTGGGPEDTGPTATVPEPATWTMMILGFAAVGYTIRRRRFAATIG